MKHFFLLMSALAFCLCAQAQTDYELLTVVEDTSTLFQLKSTTIEEDGSEMVELSPALDSLEMSDYLKRQIFRQRRLHHKASVEAYNHEKQAVRLQSRYKDLTGGFWAAYAKDRFSQKFVGTWVLREYSSQLNLLLDIRPSLAVRDATTEIVIGNLGILSQDVIELRNYLPNNNLVFFRVSEGIYRATTDDAKYILKQKL